MRYALLLLFGLILSQTKAQKIAMMVDSSTIIPIAMGGYDLSSTQAWLDLSGAQVNRGLYRRLDSLQYDYAFIDSRTVIGDTTKTVVERYFKATDSLPKYFYINGKAADIAKFYDYSLVWYSANVVHNYTLEPMVKRYSALKLNQEIPYDTLQVMVVGCVVDKEKEEAFAPTKIRELGFTYQLQTFINRKDKKLLVSLQKPVQRPQFKVLFYNPVCDW